MKTQGTAGQSRFERSSLVRTAAALLSSVVTAVVTIACLVGLTWVSHHAGAPDPEPARGSGIVVFTEITAVWIPQPLLDLARDPGGSPLGRSPEAVRAYLGRHGWRDPWYALTYRFLQVNGELGGLTQVRDLSDSPDDLDELQAVMATAAGRPPRFESRDFALARIEVGPDALQGVEPREAITRLMAESSVR
jgi:hypothetical protein